MKTLLKSSVALLFAAGTVAALVQAQTTPPAPPAGAPPAGASAPPAPSTPATAPDGAITDPVSPDQLHQFSLDRYQKIIDKSPFTYAIKKTEAPPAISPFVDWALGGFTIDEGKGVTTATLINRKTNQIAIASSAKPNDDGIQLVALTRGKSGVSDSVVRLRKGADEDDVKYDEKVASARKPMVAAGAAMRGNGQPGQVNNALNLNLNRGGANAVQGQINNQLGVQANGQGVPMPPGVQANGQPVVNQQPIPQQAVQQAQPFNQQGQPQPNQQGGGEQPQGRRRVILPPPNTQ